MNLIKNSFYTWVWALSIGYSSVFASNTSWAPSSTFWVDNASTTAWNLESDDLWTAIQKYINYIMTFLYLIAVMYALWGWFQILTAWGDEEKVKKWKTILIQWAMWLLVIWLAWTIVKWVLWVLAN